MGASVTGSHDDLTIADRALFAAMNVWGTPVEDRFWDSFGPAWKARLLEGWASTSTMAPDAARERLRLEHRAETRPDLGRVHSSWLIRALKDESPAVRRAVSANAPPAIREVLCAKLGFKFQDLENNRTACPEALSYAVLLWTERLVGDVDARDNDPLVIRALTQLDHRSLSRLIQAVGLLKWALTWQDPPALRARDRERFAHFRTIFQEPNPRLKQLARFDVTRGGAAGRHEEGRLGLLTIARLLEVAEPYRVRWALQHIPYPVARFTRALMNPKPRRDSSLVPWESEILRAAWDRIDAERRNRDHCGGLP